MPNTLKNPTIDMQVEDLPWEVEDWAFNQIALTFEIDDQMVDEMNTEERAYWAAFTSAVASLITEPEDKDSPPATPGSECLRTFDEQTRQLTAPVHMLHELANFVKLQRSRDIFPYTGVSSPDATVTPELIYGWAIGDLIQQNPALFVKK